MNIYKALNEITEYIDLHLEDSIDYHVLSKIMGVNEYTMKRIFSLLTNISITEYIRKRRLTSAAYDLYQSHMKVIDVAMKYQYDNATSFSRAFTKFHGVKPSKVTSLTKLKNFPRLTFNENVKVTSDMEYHIVESPIKILYGMGVPTTSKKIGRDAPSFFAKMEKKYSDLYGPISYGMITYQDSDREVCDSYYVLYEKEIPSFEKIVIPASKWLVFHTFRKAKDIQQLSHQFYFEFLPSCRYNLKDLPELEYYHDGVCEFLVAID